MTWSCLQGKDGTVVRGTSHTLQKRSCQSSRAFPSHGRIVVRHGDASAECTLELPAAQTRSCDDLEALPKGMWITIGRLGENGLALQLRLKRTAEPSERDKAEGTWHVYHVIRGVVTLRDAIDPPEPQAGPKVQPLATRTLASRDEESSTSARLTVREAACQDINAESPAPKAGSALSQLDSGCPSDELALGAACLSTPITNSSVTGKSSQNSGGSGTAAAKSRAVLNPIPQLASESRLPAASVHDLD